MLGTRSFAMVFALITVLSCLTGQVLAATTAKNGTILHATPFDLPTYDTLPAVARQAWSPHSYETFLRRARTVQIEKIAYASDGLIVKGFLLHPLAPPQTRLPVVVWNRGGIGEGAKLGLENLWVFSEMISVVNGGFAVVASQYRGIDGGDGTDEIGGSDVQDIFSLYELAKRLPYADASRLYLYGHSRGGLMALQAIRQGLPVRAAVVVAPPTDWAALVEGNRDLEALCRKTWPDADSRWKEHIDTRSPVRWTDRLNVPLLIFCGRLDQSIPPAQTLAFVQRLQAAGKTFAFYLYADEDHMFQKNAEDRMSRTVDWFKSRP